MQSAPVRCPSSLRPDCCPEQPLCGQPASGGGQGVREAAGQVQQTHPTSTASPILGTGPGEGTRGPGRAWRKQQAFLRSRLPARRVHNSLVRGDSCFTGRQDGRAGPADLSGPQPHVVQNGTERPHRSPSGIVFLRPSRSQARLGRTSLHQKAGSGDCPELAPRWPRWSQGRGGGCCWPREGIEWPSCTVGRAGQDG